MVMSHAGFPKTKKQQIQVDSGQFFRANEVCEIVGISRRRTSDETSRSVTSQSGRITRSRPSKKLCTGIIVENCPWKQRFMSVVSTTSSRW